MVYERLGERNGELVAASLRGGFGVRSELFFCAKTQRGVGDGCCPFVIVV
jgi:hypothetical protein